MSAPREPGFDRLKPRAPRADAAPVGSDAIPDQDGKRALFSSQVEPATAAPGSVTVTCSECEASTSVSVRQAALLAAPSIHLPFLRRGHGSYMRCPACGERTWVALSLHL